MKRDPNPFVWRCPHHLYTGLMLLFLAWTMWPYWYYHPLAEIFAVLGAFAVIDDVIEHTLTRKTPLRMLFEKVLFPLLVKISKGGEERCR